MKRFETTGATVPAWIREAVRREEAAWPWWVLAAGLALALAGLVFLGALLWTSGAVFYYARP